MNTPQLVVIDDEADLGSLVCDVAEQSGFGVSQFTSARQFMEQYNGCVDVIVLDLMMPDIDGIEVIRFLSQNQCPAQIIIMSGFDSTVLHSAQKLASERGLSFAGSLTKPFRLSQLTELLESLEIKARCHSPGTTIEPPSAAELKQALENNELVVFFQPKISLNGDSKTAAEALVRWQHPEHGLLTPDYFIDTAEQHGLIDQLTWVVLRQVMSQCSQWHDQGLGVQVAVNMSAHTLKDLNLPEQIGNMLQQFALDPSHLVLEVTETALMEELIKSLDILTRLRMRGIRLSIDDFGTGYSSLIQLYRAPFSEIKIDRSFVAEMDNDQEAATIVQTIIDLGKNLNMKTVAEGVETEDCKDRLKALGCEQAQGYLFARPMPADEFFRWYQTYPH